MKWITSLLFAAFAGSCLSQSNLVFVEPVSYEFVVSPPSNNSSITQNIVIEDSFCLKLTQASVFVLESGGDPWSPTASSYQFILLLDNAVLLAYPYNGTLNQALYYNTDMNLWVNSGTRALKFRRFNGYSGNWTIKLSGVKYKQVPIDLE